MHNYSINARQRKKLKLNFVSCEFKLQWTDVDFITPRERNQYLFQQNRCVRSYSFHVHHESQFPSKGIVLIVHHETKVTPKLILCRIEKYSKNDTSVTLQWIIIAIA